MPWEIVNDGLTSEELKAAGELIAVHAALLPTGAAGQVVYFGDWSAFGGKTLTRTLDLASDPPSSSDLPGELPSTNLFCAGQSLLADGRLLVAGGRVPGGGNLPKDHPLHPTHEPGERACWTLNPRAQRWTPAHALNPQPGSDDRGGGRWYPTLLTLGSGEVLAVAGHPAEDDTFEGRHNNHTPERYAPTSDEWTQMAAGAQRSAPADYPTDSYPRFHLTNEGTAFCDTLGLYVSLLQMPRAYTPYGGTWTSPSASPISDHFYDRGSAATSVLLPLLPSDGYRPRVLAVNGLSAYRIDAGDQDTGWKEVSERVGTIAGQRRDNGCAVLLPTAQVALVGGVQDSRTANALPAFQPELYDPGIEWPPGEYDDLGPGPANLGKWVDFGADPSAIARGYHSTALLLPDGRVWAGGSTEVDSSPFEDEERRMDVWAPPYPPGARPQLDFGSVPQSIAYGAQFSVQLDIPSGDAIRRVALIRCGSVTHGFDSDQRYVGLNFIPGAALWVTAPPTAEIAPPGYYLLWVIDSAGRPSERAAFIRVCDQELDVLLERSTISRHEVTAMGAPATFTEAFYVILDGFMPHELGDPPLQPEVRIEWLDGNEIQQIVLNERPTDFEDPTLPADRAQRVTFPYDLVVVDESLFDDVPDAPEGLEVRLRVSWRHYDVERRLRLTLKLNPHMNDGPVEWLSTDLRAFQAGPDDEHQPGLTVGDDPLAFLSALLDAWNNEDIPAEDHPFLDLPDQMDETVLELSASVGGKPVFNFAIAKVRMIAPELEKAEDVRVFFRLFPTWSLGFEYDGETYPRSGEGGQALPQIGVLGGELRTIPFFAAARDDNLIAPGDVDVNTHTFEGQGTTEVHRYYGCWLDFNHNTAVKAELRGDHPCLVAEIHYPDDPLAAGATPGSSDNLAQRNLAVVGANPASTMTRLIDMTFLVTPSRFPARPPGAGSITQRRRGRCDELMLRWGNVPPETHATIYWPDVDADAIIAAAGTRLGPRVLSRVDAHTIRCRVGGTTYMPIPGPRATDIPGLLTLELPPDLVKGQRFRMTAHQVDSKRRIVGSAQLDIPISTAEELLPREERRLGSLRWIAQSLKPGDRWLPIFKRWLDNIEGRVRGMGGEPDAIAPDGPGKRPDVPSSTGVSVKGKVRELLYDCHGDFAGFAVEDCHKLHVFHACEPGVERVVQRACELRTTVTVTTDRRDPSRPQRITTHCCGQRPC